MKYKFSYLTKIVKIKIVTKIKNSYREEGHKVGRESFINEIPPSSAAYVRHDMWDVNPLVPGDFFLRISLPKLVERCIAWIETEI